MPSYVLHLTAAKMFLNLLQETHPIKADPSAQNDFLAGNLMPDAARDKAISHFRNPVYQGKIMEYPNLHAFYKKYSHLMNDPCCLGYFFHLYIDRRFFKDYIPKVASFFTEDSEITDEKSCVSKALLHKSNTMVPFTEYLSEKYYYGDYTKMGAYLAHLYCLPTALKTPLQNPGITEVDFNNIRMLLDELTQLLTVPDDLIKDLKVFDLSDLLRFLEQSTEDFMKHIPEL